MLSIHKHSNVIVHFTLLILLFVSFGLRAWGSDFGLPDYVYHPDESAIVERAARILRTGDFNPKWFHYPTAYIYLQTFSYIVYFLYGAARGNFAFVPQHTLPQFYLIGRLTTALIGSVTVLVVYHIGRKAFNKRVGLVAATLQTGSYLSTVHSHYITTDIPSTLWVSLTALFAICILKDRQLVWYLLTGFFAGLAASTKYNAGLIFILLPTAHLLCTSWGEWGYLDRFLIFGVLATIVGFMVGTPYALFDLPEFLNGIGFELNHYNTSHIGYTGNSGHWYLSSLLKSADAPLAFAYIIGIIIAILQTDQTNFLLLVFPLLYFIGLARTPVHFERNLLPLIPSLSVLAGVGLRRIAMLLVSHVKCPSPNLLMAGLTIAIVIVPIIVGILFNIKITQADIRPKAGEWVRQNIPEDSKIAIEHYSIPFSHDHYNVTDVLRLWDHSVDWYQRKDFDYLIISNGIWLTLFKDPARYEAEIEVFQDVNERYQLLAEFAPRKIPVIVTSGYPTIREYHFPHVWIFKVKR